MLNRIPGLKVSITQNHHAEPNKGTVKRVKAFVQFNLKGAHISNAGMMAWKVFMLLAFSIR